MGRRSQPTQFVIGISNFVRDNIFLTLILLVAGYFGSKFLLKTKAGSKYFDLLSIKLPKVGDLVSKVNIARITRTFERYSPVGFYFTSDYDYQRYYR